jgi:hypothetical protein
MSDLDRDLADRLHCLADDLTGEGDVSAAGAVERWRRQRRTRRTLTAVAAVVAAVAIGVPTAAGQLSSAPDPGDVARPGPTATAPTSSDTAPTSTSPASTPASPLSSVPDEYDAEVLVHLAEGQAGLARLGAELSRPVALTSPAAWDRWLPGMKPYPGVSTEDDISTCPVLSDGLSSALGHRMSYWVGTLPMGPVGCTWAPVPLQYDTIDYPFSVSVGFVGDGTTPAELAGSWVTVVEDQPSSCPSTDVAGGGVLSACWNQGTTSYELAVPDARGAGVWVLGAEADDDADVTAEDAFLALVDGVTRNYG